MVALRIYWRKYPDPVAG